jgi:TonB family protein
MAAEAIRLTVIRPDGSTEELSFDQDSVIIGSGASANVKLDDPKVSSIHAMIKVEDGKVRAIDLGSESGTRVAGKDVQDQELDNGDVVELGGTKVRVVYGGDDLADAVSTEVIQRPKEIEAERAADAAVAAAGVAAGAAAAAVAEPQSTEIVQALQPEASATNLFSEVLPAEERPTPDHRMLEVVMVWSETVIGIGHYVAKDPVVTIGDGPKNHFHLASDLIPASRFPFLKPEGQDHVVTIAEGMDIRVREDDGKVLKLDELQKVGRLTRADASFKGYSYKIGLHDQVVVHVGDTAFVLRYVRPSKRIVTSVFDQLDYYFTKVLSTSLMAHLLFMAALMLTPINTERLSDDLFTNPNRFAKLIIRAEEPEPQRRFDDLSGIEEGKKAKDDEGKFGKKEEIQEKAAPSEAGAPIVDVDQREEDRKKVMETGLLAALDDGAASNVFGPGGLGTGINQALGGIDGDAAMGDAHGLGGLGSRGAGAGGGGTALGIGGLGTKGGGKGRGGHGNVDLGGRGRSPTKITSGRTVIEGGLDREVIARIVRRHQNEIRYCYERELQRDPNLHGRVAVLWIIDGTGAVAQASIADSSMGNANVENCMLTRIRRWRFPEPRGGGIVRVTYPWIFSPRG